MLLVFIFGMGCWKDYSWSVEAPATVTLLFIFHMKKVKSGLSYVKNKENLVWWFLRVNECKYIEKLRKCLGGMQVGEFVLKKQEGKREEDRKCDQKSDCG